jgi:hypothetical protein
MTEAQNMAKAERKPRRNIQYKDIGNPFPTFPVPSTN